MDRFQPFITESNSDAELNNADYTNAIKIYNAMKNLTPLSASNKNMWTYLSHCTYEEYVRNRWLSKAPTQKTIAQRYFVNNTKESLFLNALSRLWWGAKITYDENNANHFHLTKVLFSVQRTFQELEHTKNSMNIERTRGVLQALENFKEENPRAAISEMFRECNKKLNRMAAITNFNELTSDEIQEITYNYLADYSRKK
ncbi:DUF6339 family protein [Chryseobacterium sp.]|uniref:DUF6339 family protein n=1 Tax=Chryseobacterium sp. TaxID=1871047 RepID=UPI002FC826D5